MQKEQIDFRWTLISSFNFKDLELSLKAFVLYKIESYVSKTLSVFASTIKRMLNEAILLGSNLPERYQDGKYNFIFNEFRLIKEYFMFIDPYNSNEELIDNIGLKYIEFTEIQCRNKLEGKGKRALPTMETMFRFNDIIENLIIEPKIDNSMENRRKREKFFPVILWWKITTIIPMRVQEFTVIPKNCLIEKNGKPHLRFYRNDIKGRKRILFNHSFEECFREEVFPINEEISMLIEEYKELVQPYDDIDDFYDVKQGSIEREFLLSYRSYKSMKDSNRKLDFRLDVSEFFSTTLLLSIQEEFMIDYIVNELSLEIIPKSKEFTEDGLYEWQLNNISLMDTRHYAIMNMVFLGYEAATIQRIVGHSTIDISQTYFAHPEQFVKGYIISAARQDALKKNSARKGVIFNMVFNEVFGEEGSGNEGYRRFKAKQNSDNEKEKKLSIGGVCTYDKDDMLPCKLLGGNHKRCRFYNCGKIMTPEIEKEFDAITNEISAEIQTLTYLNRHRRTLVGFKEQYQVSWNKIRSKALIQAGMVSDYIICGIESEE